MSEAPVRCVSADEDSARWDGFPFRQGDIVISTRSKSGTTWMQMICALLVFQTAEPPAPLAELSPWLDLLVVPRSEVYARLEALQHRRFIKTHTPLDGIPIDARATYIVVARHPLDMAASLYHQGDNLDRVRLHQLRNQPEPEQPPPQRAELHEWLLAWIDDDVSRLEQMDSLPGVMWHLSDAWGRRDQPNVVLVHYDHLVSDLAGEMRHLAALLDIEVSEQSWPALVEAAEFSSMRSRADELAPNTLGILKSTAAFFRRGTSGAGREQLTDPELAHYRARVHRMASPELLGWLHR